MSEAQIQQVGESPGCEDCKTPEEIISDEVYKQAIKQSASGKNVIGSGSARIYDVDGSLIATARIMNGRHLSILIDREKIEDISIGGLK